MHRRVFLKALTAGTALSAAGSSPATLLGEAQSAEFPFSCVSNRSSARRIGQCYLRSVPEGGKAADYLQALLEDLAEGPEEDDPEAQLRHLIRRDYAGDRIVCVDGWYLSLTEARLCAAVALS